MNPSTTARGAFWVLLIVSLGLLAEVFLPLWEPLLLAAVLSAVLRPLNERIAHRLSGRRTAASAIVTAGVVLLILLPLVGVIAFVVAEVPSGLAFLRQGVGVNRWSELVARAPPFVAAWLHRAAELVRRTVQGEGLEAGVASAVSEAAAATSRITFGVLMMLIALFFLLIDAPRLVRWLAAASPLGAERTQELLAEVRRTGVSTLTSELTTATIQAIAATVGYVIARLPVPAFFGAITFLVAFIPTLGTSLVTLPLAALLLVLGHPWSALFLAIWGLGLVALIDNAVRPYLIHEKTELNGALLFFALIGGLMAFGAMGLLMGPLALSLSLALVRMGWRDFLARPEGEESESERSPPPQ